MNDVFFVMVQAIIITRMNLSCFDIYLIHLKFPGFIIIHVVVHERVAARVENFTRHIGLFKHCS